VRKTLPELVSGIGSIAIATLMSSSMSRRGAAMYGSGPYAMVGAVVWTVEEPVIYLYRVIVG
jgi:ABC-type amino acid transport substrate-binding protein